MNCSHISAEKLTYLIIAVCSWVPWPRPQSRDQNLNPQLWYRWHCFIQAKHSRRGSASGSIQLIEIGSIWVRYGN